MDTIKTTVATKLNQHKNIAKDTVDEIWKVKIDYLSLWEKEKQPLNCHIKETYNEFKNEQKQFDTDITFITTKTMNKLTWRLYLSKEK